jgi:hypothetical protein
MADRPDRAGEPQNLFPLLSTRAASPLQAIQLNRRRDKRNRAVFLSIAAARHATALLWEAFSIVAMIGRVVQPWDRIAQP